MHSNRNFTTTIIVDQTPDEVFDAITRVRAWWSEEIEGSTSHLGDEFNYHYQDVHRCKMKLIEVVPGQKMVWYCMDNYFSFTNDQSEWKDTRIIFEMSKSEGKTTMRFEHEGLVPEYECYELCHEGWSNYINKSLYGLITTGKGSPNTKQGNEYQASVDGRIPSR